MQDTWQPVGTSCGVCDTWHSCWKSHFHCSETGGVDANNIWGRSEMVMQKQNWFSFWLSLYMWNWSYIWKCIISLKCIVLLENTGAIPTLILVCLPPSLARKGKAGVLYLFFFHGAKSARNNCHLVSCYSYAALRWSKQLTTFLLPLVLLWDEKPASFARNEFYCHIICDILNNKLL